MADLVELLDEEKQNELLWKTLQKLAKKIRPYVKGEISVDSSLNDPLEFFLMDPHYYIKVGKKKILGVLLGFPGPRGFFGRKKTNERRILSFHNAPANIMGLIKEALREYASVCHATEIVLEKEE
jgi:hypothetical protein